MGSTNPTLSKHEKIITQNVDQQACLIYYFLLFEEKEIKHNKHINNQNQEAFIVIIINYIFSVFLLCFLCETIFLKYTNPKNQIILSFFHLIDPILSLSCP